MPRKYDIDTTIATLLFVCEGNVCRSPWAEQVVRHALGPESTSGIRIESAGTRALVGEAMDDAMAALLAPLRITPDGHRARQLDVDMLRRASVILTATTDQRGAVARLHPAAVRRTMTVRQLGRLLLQPVEVPTPVAGDSAPERVASLLTWATQRRGSTMPMNSRDDDVVDPYRQNVARHVLAAEQMHPALRVLCRALAGPGILLPNFPDA